MKSEAEIRRLRDFALDGRAIGPLALAGVLTLTWALGDSPPGLSAEEAEEFELARKSMDLALEAANKESASPSAGS